jgi:hypothetical protein
MDVVMDHGCRRGSAFSRKSDRRHAGWRSRPATEARGNTGRYGPSKRFRRCTQPIEAVMHPPLSSDQLMRIDAYWRAANYLSVGQIYLYDNPLLKQPLTLAHIKPRLLGHWGTTPGLSFLYVHLNRIIQALDLDMIFITGPGHGGPALVANTYLEGTYSEIYPHISQDEAGLQRLFKQFSFRLRDRRWRSGDRPARDELAFEQVPEPRV